MKRGIKFYICGLFLFCIGICPANVQETNTPKQYVSENKQFIGFVRLPDANSQTNVSMLQVFKIEDPRFLKYDEEIREIIEEHGWNYLTFAIKLWQEKGWIKILWQNKLNSGKMPVDVYISNDGNYAVALDSFGKYGFGDEVVGFYNKDVQIKKYSLSEVLTPALYKKAMDENRIRLHNSSIMWRFDGLEFFFQNDKQLLFCIWLQWDDRWAMFDCSNGQRLKPDEELLKRIDGYALKRSREAFQKLAAPDTNISSACMFLAKMKIPEDRKILEKYLQHISFGPSLKWKPKTNDKDNMEQREYELDEFWTYSPIRLYADIALSVWDGKISGVNIDTEKYQYNYLCIVKGKVKLPEKFDYKEYKGGFAIYLIPEEVKKGNLPSFKPSYGMTFFSSLSGYTFEKQILLPFTFYGVKEGKYWLKIYLLKTPQHNYSGSATIQMKSEQYEIPWMPIYQAKIGDYENSDEHIFEVKAGQTIDVGTINCDSLVKE